MKQIKIIFLLVFVCMFIFLATLVLNYQRNTQIPKLSPNTSPQLPTPTPLTINFAQQSFHIYIQPVTSEKKVKLITNFGNKQIASALAKTNACLSAINAGFYTSDNLPLGLFYTDGKFINSNLHSSQTLNGFVYQMLTGDLVIESNQPAPNTYTFLFQSGPLFTPQSKLVIQNDEPARRILLGQTAAGQFLFLALTDSDNTNSGPFLADLPQVIKKHNDQLEDPNQKLTKLVNLDGGAASVFISPSFHLSEITPVGSLLCQT